MHEKFKEIINELTELAISPNLKPLVSTRLKQLEWAYLITAQREAYLREIADNLQLGIFVIDEFRTEIWKNRYADKILTKGSILTLDPHNNKISCSNRRSAERLRNLVHQIFNTGNSNGTSHSCIFTITNELDSLEYLAALKPLKNLLSFNGASVPAAVLYLAQSQVRKVPDVKHFAGLWGMAPVQSRIAHQLIQGKRLDQIAADLGITTNTARSHLKQIFSKTQTQRQVEIIQLLEGLFGFVEFE